MRGKLFGIGVGPGDPELLTLKAIRTIERCGVIAVPAAGSGERTAFSIVEPYLRGKELLECRFAMEHDVEKRRTARQTAAERVMERLAAEQDVGFITLGDPVVYATYMYVHEIVTAAGFDAEIIPGVTSFSAAAAALGIALCEEDEPLTVIPARHSGNVETLLDFPGNKVIMKSGKNLANVLNTLKERGLGDRTKLACRVTMEGQRLYSSIEEYEAAPESGYFTVAIVKQRGRRA
jgi:precorrin-2/cobalt-factor-2 C20-methyltransferase